MRVFGLIIFPNLSLSRQEREGLLIINREFLPKIPKNLCLNPGPF